MIIISNKEDCCGCEACAQRCPRQCITMLEDEEGFLYPHINTDLCIDCCLCEKVCPVINQNESREPLEVYAAKNLNEEIRLESSSGGIFSILAENTIEQGGVVFGARWNEQWEVVHDFTETKEGLSAFKSSKYLQSRIGNCFKQVEIFLKQGRPVLFTGTPCQIAGLKKFLRKEYDNLLAVEVFCHSVPSPGIWKIYLKEVLQNIKWNKTDIASINFRDKRKSWKNYHFVMQHRNGDVFDEKASKNPFMRGFLKNLYTRPSCYACPAKALKSCSDITMGDYWGIEILRPKLDDDKGISAVVVNTTKGQIALDRTKAEILPMNYKQLCQYNPALLHSSHWHQKRDEFYSQIHLSFFQKIEIFCRTSVKSRVKAKVVYVLRKYFRQLTDTKD